MRKCLRCVRQILWIGAIATAVILVGPANAQVPELLAVSNIIPQPDRGQLNKQRGSLSSRLAKLEGETGAFNLACKSVDKGSAAAANCRIRFSELNGKRQIYTIDANAFNYEVRTKTAHYQKFPEPPSPYEFFGRGLIGGVGWTAAPYDFNAPPDLTEEQRLIAEINLDKARELAGIKKNEFVDPREYNFILGLAISRTFITDTLFRALRDNLNQGRATPQIQQKYELLRGKSFKPLDCHSNGAMICLSALANGDVAAKDVRLFGPQITPMALNEWKRLLRSGQISSLKIYISEADPIPPLSYVTQYLLQPAEVAAADLKSTAEVLKNYVTFKRRVEEAAPSIEVIHIPCADAGPYRFSRKCHYIDHYLHQGPKGARQ